jgi:hypothetical protein
MGNGGDENVEMWKQPIPMLPIINVATRIGYWVLALATFSHWHIPFREGRFRVSAQAPWMFGS